MILFTSILYLLFALAWCTGPYWYDLFKLSEDEFGPYGLDGTPFTGGYRGLAEWDLAVALIFFFGGLIVAQYLFLMPRGAWTARVSSKGRPLRSSILIAALMATLLTLGAVALITEIPDAWSKWMNFIGDDPEATSFGEYPEGFATASPFLAGGILLGWMFWAFVFAAYWRKGDRYSQLTSMLRALIAGSLLEALVAIPVHVWVMRHRECHCARGTYTALVCAGTVLLWAFGPGIVLLYMYERHRMARLFPRCQKCDYDLRGIDSSRCLECGTSIVSEPVNAQAVRQP